VRFSGAALTEDVEEHIVDGVTVRVTGVAKTVADCFKCRNKIGLDVTLEALREAWSEKRMTSDDIWRYAKVCRVANVMRPYLEILAGAFGTSERPSVTGCCWRPTRPGVKRSRPGWDCRLRPRP
jgi:hypothetical protein